MTVPPLAATAPSLEAPADTADPGGLAAPGDTSGGAEAATDATTDPAADLAAPGVDPLALPVLPPQLVDDGSDELPRLDPPPVAPETPREEVHELASIARETWIFAEPRWTARRIGYLRAGAIVARRPKPSGKESCGGGWYRIEPSGYVCIGASATLNIHDIAVEASSRRPIRRFFAEATSPAAPDTRAAALSADRGATRLAALGDAAPAAQAALGDAALAAHAALGDAAPAAHAALGDAASAAHAALGDAAPAAHAALGDAAPAAQAPVSDAAPAAQAAFGEPAPAAQAALDNAAPAAQAALGEAAPATPAALGDTAPAAQAALGDTVSAPRPATPDAELAAWLNGLPYIYVMSRSPTPPLYARLPTEDEQRSAEPDLGAHLRRAATAARAPDFVAPPPPDATPSVLLYGRPAPGLAGDRRAPDALVLGRARTRSGFALLSTFDHDGRLFGLTTDLAVLPLDRTRVVRPSTFSGLRLAEDAALPVAFAKRRNAARLVPGERGGYTSAPLRFREAIPLSGASRRVGGVDHLEARDGSLVRADDVVRIDPLPRAPAWAVRGRKWIDVSINQQSLVAYEGTRPVYVTLVSTGADGLGDWKTTRSTIQGLFRIHTKHVTVTMDGDEEDEDPFDFRDVPFVQYFTEGFAFHAAYWHDDFGTPRSHGCINLAPLDAAWLFEWTTPEVPATWHGALSLRKGTLVSIRP
ncbi:L,D-transpeptidase [Sorangium sp. So ce513]|uniref:L,D-transpeptidase n=1 Tax=Sorangium sp. So ce513 TaxID=3133315 RepID=UPI003F646FBE